MRGKGQEKKKMVGKDERSNLPRQNFVTRTLVLRQAFIYKLIQIYLMDQSLIQHCKDTLRKNHLDPVKKLGKGGFGIVYLVSQNNFQQSNSKFFSVKCTSKKQFVKKPVLRRYLKQEISLLQSLQHENIVRLVRTFEDDGWIFMVMEYCNLGNISTIQAEKREGIFTFEETAQIIHEVISGLMFMHQKKIIHRDIKPQNILQVKEKGKTTTKICDLGFSREANEDVGTFCGTTYYMAPQLFLKKKYNSKVDNWAVGVLIFSMLFANVPFKSVNMETQIINKCDRGFELPKARMKKNSSLNEERFKNMSEMFEKIFEIDPEKRLELGAIMPYFGRSSIKACIKIEKEKKRISHKKTIDTESSSEEERETISFELQKVNFVQSVLEEVKEINFLQEKEFKLLKYYLDKICLQLLQFQKDSPLHQQSISTFSTISQNVRKTFATISETIDDCHIPQLKEIFNYKMLDKFNEYKEEYRVVVGHAFYKAHKAIENTDLKMRTKLKIFCCHVINRVFEKEYRKQIFSHYFQWVQKNTDYEYFDLRALKKWMETEKLKKVVETIEIINNRFYKKNGK